MSQRTPPHDLDAERALLSAMASDSYAMDVVADLLSEEDFYAANHQALFRAAAGLHSRSEPVDMVSVRRELSAAQKLAQAGGEEYLLHALSSTQALGREPESLAQDVARLARLRRAIVTCLKLAGEGYTATDVEAYLDRVESEIHAATEERVAASGPEPIKTAIRETFEQIKEAAESGYEIRGLSTGLKDLDDKLAGLKAGELIIVAGRPGMGKAQPYSSRVMTPLGWRRMGDLRVGDRVCTPDGSVALVRAVHERGRREVFEVRTSDGGAARCTDDHLWFTSTRADRRAKKRGSVRSLREIRASLRRGDGGRNHALPRCGVLHLESGEDQPVDPWLLGVYLGDGCSRSSGTATISNVESDIRDRIAGSLPEGDGLSESKDGRYVSVVTRGNARRSRLAEHLHSLGLWGLGSHRKFIPRRYQIAPWHVRAEVLRGLVDTDGYVFSQGGSSLVEIATVSPEMRDDVMFVAGSLGGRCTWTTVQPHYTNGGQRTEASTAYRVRMSFPGSDFCPASSEKHLRKWVGNPRRCPIRYIDDVTRVGVEGVRCITLDSNDGLYVTDDFLVTHNSAFAGLLCTAAAKSGETALGFSLEMPRIQWAKRFLAGHARVDGHLLRTARVSDRSSMRKLVVAAKEVSDWPIYLDDQPALTVTQIRSRARRIKAKHGLGLVIVDYLQLARAGAKHNNREQEISEISRSLKALAKELEVPVVALSQLNRGVEYRTEKRPVMSDLRESGSLEQDADVILLLYRDEVYRPNDTDDEGVAEIIIGKQREGSMGTVRARFEDSFTRFDNLDTHQPEPDEYDAADYQD